MAPKKKTSAAPQKAPTTTNDWWQSWITEQDMAMEEELLRDSYNLKLWLQYLERKQDASTTLRFLLYERALKALPGSYKLWKRYLDERRRELEALGGDRADDDAVKQDNEEDLEALRLRKVNELNHCYERALIFQHKMPRIWLDFCEFLMAEGVITRTRRTFDRALRSLPITQHKRMWEPYLDFVKECGVVETAVRVQRRFLKLDPSYAEDFIDHLIANQCYNEAVEQMISLLDKESFTSKHGKNSFQLWMELAELISEHPKEIKTVPAEAILRSGILRYTDQVGKLWNYLARYWILSGNFEKARDIYEEAIQTVMTVRDFTQVFDAYAEFEESVLSAKISKNAASAKDEEDVELDLRLARFEKLMDRRPFLVNDVHLRQNPNNVLEWIKRIELWGDNEEKVLTTYKKAFETIQARKAHGRLQDLWISYARLLEEKAVAENATNPNLDATRKAYEDSLEVTFKHPDSLAECYIAYAEMELRHENAQRAIDIYARGTATPPGLRRPINSINYLDEAIPSHVRLFKSIKLWGHFVDLEEAIGTVESTKAVYDRIMELKICTPQTVVNYAAFLEDNKYYEESFKVYERGIELFGYPIAFDLWNIYLQKFMDRYGGLKLERARDLFEQALENCPEKYCKAIYLLYGKLEETHGLAKKAMQIYDRATQAVPMKERFEMYNFYIVKAVDFFGLTSARPIYERAIERLPDQQTREMCLRFAELEIKLGEMERARSVYGHASQLCDPRIDPGFWKIWHDFEVRHGNEETFKEMLRIKRSVQAKFNHEVDFLSQQLLANRQRAVKSAAAATVEGASGEEVVSVPAALTVPKPSMMFVSGGTTINGRKVDGGVEEEGKPAAAVPVNPDEITLEMDEDDG